MHLHRGKFGEDVGHVFELGPVELDVLARREMPVAAVVGARNVRELAQLRRREQPVGNRHAQHRRVALDVEAVAQPQRPKLVLGQLPGKETAGLAPKLGDPLIHQPLVDFVIDVHATP